MFERMGIYFVGLDGGFISPESVRNPHPHRPLCVPRHGHGPTVVTFCLSPSYGFSTAREAHDWFMRMMRQHDEFEVETDRVGPLSFWSETVRRVVVG